MMEKELVEIATTPMGEAQEAEETELADEPEVDVYLRVFTDTVEAADEVLLDMGDDFFAPATYLGSATLDYEVDSNVQDRCHMLIGLRGTPDQVSENVQQVFDFIKERTGVDARIQQLVVDHLIVSRTLSAGDVDLFDE